MPVWLQERPLLDLTERAVQTIKTQCDASLYIVPSRLKSELITALDLQLKASDWCGLPTKVVCTAVIDNSVAKCWNIGCEEAFRDGCHFVLIQANDVMLEPGTIDTLVQFGLDNWDVDLWSALAVNLHGDNLPQGVGDSADFCCFMLRPTTFHRFGTFDERFRPAYFEDNDYYGRVFLGGGKCAHVFAAHVNHIGSQTMKLDPEAAHHNNYWFNINQKRFMDKWQTPRSAASPAEVHALYSRHPWGDTNRTVAYWDRE